MRGVRRETGVWRVVAEGGVGGFWLVGRDWSGGAFCLAIGGEYRASVSGGLGVLVGGFGGFKGKKGTGALRRKGISNPKIRARPRDSEAATTV